jgi:deoxyribodipyrimidine photo-lyase
MYLHFGQISALYVALHIANAMDHARKDKEAFLEQLIVRRELAMNFVYFTARYDSYRSVPEWARQTLAAHESDHRRHRYSPRQLELAETHDHYWNAAHQEMRHTGYMHNYMRMYWSKKILEWSRSPERAFRTTLALMNKYFLDARDPNGYTNVAGTYGLHDRPWQDRPVFGKVRYMSAAGLERKADMQAYLKKVETLVAQRME